MLLIFLDSIIIIIIESPFIITFKCSPFAITITSQLTYNKFINSIFEILIRILTLIIFLIRIIRKVINYYDEKSSNFKIFNWFSFNWFSPLMILCYSIYSSIMWIDRMSYFSSIYIKDDSKLKLIIEIELYWGAEVDIKSFTILEYFNI